MRFVFSTAAQRELLAAIRYYENQWSGLGGELLEEVDKALSFIRLYPYASAVRKGDVRQRPLRRFPFAIFYAIRNDEIIVLSVAHTHRSPACWEDS